MIRARSVTIATTPTLIATGGAISDRRTVILKGAAAAFSLGPSDVAVATGLPMATTDALSIDLGPGDALYGIAAVQTTVFVLETRY